MCTFAVAGSAFLGLCVCLATTAVAVLANDILGRGEACRLALVKLLERNLILLHFILALPRATPARHTTTHTGHTTHTLKATSHSSHTAKHLRQNII